MSAPIIAITMATDSLQHLNVAHLSDSIKNLHRPLVRASLRVSSSSGSSSKKPTSPLALTKRSASRDDEGDEEEDYGELGDGGVDTPPETNSPSPTPPRPRKFSSLSPSFSFSRFGSLKQLTRQVSYSKGQIRPTLQVFLTKFTKTMYQ